MNVARASQCYVSTISQTSLKWNTQRRLSGTFPWRLKQVSNETPNNVSVVRTHNVSLVRLYDISCNSQMKHPITSLLRASLHHISELHSCDALFLLRSSLRFQVTLSWPPYGRFSRLSWISNRTPNFSSTNHEGNKKRSLDYKVREFQLSLKTALYINSICNIYCVDTHKCLSKTICCLKKNHNKKSAERKCRNLHYISILKLQDLISRISVPPFPSVQPFADVLQNRCS